MQRQPAQTSDNVTEGEVFKAAGSDYDVPNEPSEHRRSIDLNDILTSDLSNGFPQQENLETTGLLLGTDQKGISTSPANEGSLGFSIRHQKHNSKQNTANNCRETDVLRHFRYHVGPWIDTGDSNSGFGVQVLLRSRLNRPLQSAVLALSAGQMSLFSQPLSEDVHSLMRFRKEVMDSLALQPDLVGRAGQTLLLLQELLPVGLQRWRDLISPHIDSSFSLISPEVLAEELGESLFWLQFRLGTSHIDPALVSC